MLKDHSNKIRAFHSHGFLAVVVGIIFVPEGDHIVIYGDDPAVCDCCAVGITGKITDGIASSVEGLLDERKPGLLEQGIDKGLPSVRILKVAAAGKI